MGLPLPPAEAEEGWCSEWHGSYRTWLQSLSKAVDHGVLLVIDYALEAARYYAARRSDGTLMAYQGGAAGLDPLASPGAQDLTSRLHRPLGCRRRKPGLAAAGSAPPGGNGVGLGVG